MAAPGVQVRPAAAGDAAAVAVLAEQLAQSFPFRRAAFDASFPALLARPGACLLVAELGEGGPGDGPVGYLLGFEHLTFYAGGPVGWVEEVLVRPEHRGGGVGRALMAGFEGWAVGRGCSLVALATRRAAAFYRALGYAESAAYLRKVLPAT